MIVYIVKIKQYKYIYIYIYVNEQNYIEASFAEGWVEGVATYILV